MLLTWNRVFPQLQQNTRRSKAYLKSSLIKLVKEVKEKEDRLESKREDYT